MQRRRITTCVAGPQEIIKTLVKFRHSFLNQNENLKNSLEDIFEEDSLILNPSQTKQRFNIFSKTLFSTKRKFFTVQLKNEAQQDLKILKENRQFIQNDCSSHFQKSIIENQVKNLSSKEQESNQKQLKQYKTSSNQTFSWNKKPFRQKNYFTEHHHSKQKNQNVFHISNSNVSTKKPNLKILYERKQNSMNASCYKLKLSKKQCSSKSFKQKSNSSKQNKKCEIKRLWECNAIRLKRKQNETIHKLLLIDNFPNERPLLIHNQHQTSHGHTFLPSLNSKKENVSNLENYEQRLKQLVEIGPKYGLKQRSMSTSKTDFIKNRNKHFLKIY